MWKHYTKNIVHNGQQSGNVTKKTRLPVVKDLHHYTKKMVCNGQDWKHYTKDMVHNGHGSGNKTGKRFPVVKAGSGNDGQGS